MTVEFEIGKLYTNHTRSVYGWRGLVFTDIKRFPQGSIFFLLKAYKESVVIYFLDTDGEKIQIVGYSIEEISEMFKKIDDI